MSTEKGPQRHWLYKIGKADTPTCQCGHPQQTGHHLTFSCPRWSDQRVTVIGDRKDWPELDDPIYIKTGPEEEDTIEEGEEWFTTIYGLLC